MEQLKRAAFFRAEGVLIRRGVLPFSAYLAANGQGFAERLTRMSQVVLMAPLYGVLSQSGDRSRAHRLLGLSFRGMTEDRIAVLSEEYLDYLVQDNLLLPGVDLIRRAHREGFLTVLISEGLANVIEPFGKGIGWIHVPLTKVNAVDTEIIDQVVCNRLEFRHGKATGRFVAPYIGGESTVRWTHEFAERHQIDLSKSRAYAAHAADRILLASVGEPCAVNPDFLLRRTIRETGWPVMEYRP